MVKYVHWPAVAVIAQQENSIRAVNGLDLFTNNSWVPKYPFFFLMDLEIQVDTSLNVPEGWLSE